MNAALLLEHYARIADAPDAFVRLRRFVLDLAVRGKLVEQNAEDELASELLKRIVDDRARLAKVGEAQKAKDLPVLAEDAAFDLPPSWVWTRLGLITSYIQRGKSPKYAEVDGVPVVSQKCVQWSGLKLDAARLITRQSLDAHENIRFLREGDLLWNSTGTGTIGRIIKFDGALERLVCDSHVTVVRCLGVNPEYVRTWLRSDRVYGSIEGRAAGSTNQVELTGQMAVGQIVPLPPLAEQHRIVAKVDELMTLCDQLKAARAEREAARDTFALSTLAKLSTPDPESFSEDIRFTLANLAPLTTRPNQIKQLRQTILNLAVRGKLAEQDPSDEPAATQLQHIADQRDALVREKAIRREKPLEPVVEEQVPFEIPSTWLWSRIGEVTLFTQYGTSEKSEPRAQGVPVLTMGNIQDGRVVWSNEKRIRASSEELPSLYLKKFDLLYNRTNSAELVGKTGIYLGDDDCRTFASYLIRIRCSIENSLPEYVNLAMNAPVFRDTQIVPLIKQQTGQANVNGTALKNMLIPFPPIAEQRRIMAKVDELTVLCEELESGITTGEQIRSRLLEAVLDKAVEPV